jgi:hypothetical protein
VTLPKPERRGPRPRKPIRRGPRKRNRTPEPLLRHRKLEERADRLWSFVVRHKSPVCIRCHTRPTAQADHLISRRYRATRWSTEIGAPLCAGCHQLVTADTHEHVRLAVLVLGAGRWELLNLAKTAGKCDPRMAIIALEAEVRAKGLTALAIERGLL